MTVNEHLAALIGIAAGLARRGDGETALKVKGHADGIRQELCPHDKGTCEHLYMSGTKHLCRGCGKEMHPVCTGGTASWCPVHGDCTCDRHEDGAVDHDVLGTCPLHSHGSTH